MLILGLLHLICLLCMLLLVGEIPLIIWLLLIIHHLIRVLVLILICLWSYLILHLLVGMLNSSVGRLVLHVWWHKLLEWTLWSCIAASSFQRIRPLRSRRRRHERSLVLKLIRSSLLRAIISLLLYWLVLAKLRRKGVSSCLLMVL